jgi:hypothetical protein
METWQEKAQKAPPDASGDRTDERLVKEEEMTATEDLVYVVDI